MQFESNAIISHDPILEYKRRIKVDPQAGSHFSVFPLLSSFIFVCLFQSKVLYAQKILVPLRAEPSPKRIKNSDAVRCFKINGGEKERFKFVKGEFPLFA